MGGQAANRDPVQQPAREAPSDRPSSPFRGYRAIEDFVNTRKLAEFAKWLKDYKPSCHHITISRAHHDLLRRWPKAAGVLGFIVTAEAVFYEGFRLLPDHSLRRYHRPPGPTQTDIEGGNT